MRIILLAIAFVLLVVDISAQSNPFKIQSDNQPGQVNVVDQDSQSEQETIVVDEGRCLTMEMDSLLRERNPSMGTLDQFEYFLQREIVEYNARKASGRIESEVITIPVILHIIHNGDAPGVGQNISFDQANSQIDAFNEHFRKVGEGTNDNPVGADIEIQFAAALYGPNGQRLSEPGVDRVNSGEDSWSSTDVDQIIKPATIWDPNRYFNIWTVNFGDEDEGLLGYAQFPSGSDLDGMPVVGGPAETDGIVIWYRTYGTTPNVLKPYHQGKTVSHEAGHWLGLRHTWGDGGCLVDDYCTDTPNAKNARWSKALLGCPTDDECGEGDRMVSNYMDYSDDPCKNTFTQEQKTRMRTVMEVSPRRKELLKSNVYQEREKPFAFFISNVTSACEGTIINFTDLSTNTPTAWSWLVKDDAGVTVKESINQNPSFLFADLGNYDVQLIATNQAGSDTLLIPNHINVVSNESTTFVNEDFEETSTALNEWLIFDPDDDRSWSFTDVSANGIGTGSVKMDNFTKDVDISSTMDGLITPPMDLTNAINPYLIFDHAYARYGGLYSDTLAIFYSVDCAESFELLWGKGGRELATAEPTETEFIPTSDQWRNNQLSIKDLVGAKQVHFAFINISGWGNNVYLDNIQIGDFAGAQAPNMVDIMVSDTLNCVGDLVQFEDHSTEYPSSWSWTFEGGIPSTSDEQNPEVRYIIAGTYDVSLTVTNEVGSNSKTFDTLITVNGNPTVDISADRTQACPGETFTLMASGADEYMWYDNRSLIPISEESTYTTELYDDRTYLLWGKITATGCTDTITQVVNLTEGVEVAIVVSDSIVCEGTTVSFEASGADSYSWYYEKELVSTTSTVELSFDISGSVGVLATLADSDCPGTDVQDIMVNQNPEPVITTDGQNLIATEAEAYQWYVNETALTGATTQTITPTYSASYTVEITDNNGCVGVSEPAVFTDFENSDISARISAYPNPTSDKLVLEVEGSNVGLIYCNLTDARGVEVNRWSFIKEQNQTSYDFELPARKGVYILTLQEGDNILSIRLIKQ